MSLEKEFCTYSQALRLKALGFDEPCLMAYIGKDNQLYSKCDDVLHLKAVDILNPLKAPTFYQAFRWFRKNYDLLGIPTYSKYTIMSNKWVGQPLYGNYNSYEEAELACLDKLLEIVESKSE